MGLLNFIKATSLVTLFAASVIAFAYLFIVTNNPAYFTGSDSSTLLNMTSKFNESISAFGSATENAKEVLNEAELSPTYLFVIFGAAFSIPIAFLGVIAGGIFAVTDALFTLMGGVGLSAPIAVAFSVMISMLVITAVFYIIQFIRTGYGER